MSREAIQELQNRNLLGYGSFIPDSVIYNLIGIEIPESGTKEQFDAIRLKELSFVGSLRELLLDHGKYIAQVPNGYRILLPSENMAQVRAYEEAGNRKWGRARRLDKSTQRAAASPPQLGNETRLYLKTTSRTRDRWSGTVIDVTSRVVSVRR